MLHTTRLNLLPPPQLLPYAFICLFNRGVVHRGHVSLFLKGRKARENSCKWGVRE
uniref:Uncharacterized protein n=1 Tax=Anguilla anguilla TaxID=7936 RepID=A0A0E9QGS6_ANGAN